MFRVAAASAALLALVPVAAMAGPTLVVDLDTQRVISAQDAFHRWYPASLTKLMTTYVAFRAVENGEMSLQSPVYVSKNAVKEPPSKMGFPAGTTLTLDAALKIIMVKSANDIATAIGESIAGSQGAFAARMNAEARRIGMTDSHFVNAHGLHSDAQYTTARDLAVLATTIRREFPQHVGYFSIDGIVVGKSRMTNHNTLIGRFDGADGMKTGYTCPSGFNLVASATRNGRTLLAVVIGSTTVEERAADAANLLAEGFASNGANRPLLSQLAAQAGEASVEAVNMRPMICTKQGRQQIAKTIERDEKGQPIIRSQHIHEPDENPVMIAVGLGGATGPESPGYRALVESQVEYADVPIPTPRPDYSPVTAASAGSSKTQ